MMEVDSDAQGMDGSVKEFEAKLIQKFADMNQPSSGGEGEIQIDAEMEQRKPRITAQIRARNEPELIYFLV